MSIVNSLRAKVSLVYIGALLGIFLAQPRPVDAAIFTSYEALEYSRQFALDPMFDPVGLLIGTDELGRNYAAGSGVLIDPYWVLTAGHVPFGNPGEYWESMSFNYSPDFYNNRDLTIGAAAWFTFPGYNSDNSPGQGNDIGLVRLSEPIYTIEPAIRFRGEDEPGTELFMAGYGRPAVWPSVGEFDGIRRAGQNIGDSLGGVSGSVDEQYWVTNLNSSSGIFLEWAGSEADSGGGWFADIDGTMQLVALTSFTRGHYTATGGIRVSLYNDWIDEIRAANPPPTTAVPEPNTLVLMSIGFAGLGARNWMKRKNAS